MNHHYKYYLLLLLRRYSDCYSADDCLHHVFGPRHAAVSAVYEQFSADCLT